MPAFRRGALAVIAAAVVMSNASQADQAAPAFERGEFPVRWSPDRPDCAGVAPFQAHEYNSSFIILRQSGCTNFEKPFLYLFFGAKEALLVDTGARGADSSGVRSKDCTRGCSSKGPSSRRLAPPSTRRIESS